MNSHLTLDLTMESVFQVQIAMELKCKPRIFFFYKKKIPTNTLDLAFPSKIWIQYPSFLLLPIIVKVFLADDPFLV